MAWGLFPLYPHPRLHRLAAEALLASLSFHYSVLADLVCPHLLHLVAYKMVLVITLNG